MSLYKYWLKYPQILEEKDWNKHKGILAKVVKRETGITDKLKAARKAFEQINPAYWSDVTVETGSKASCAKALKELATEFSRSVKPCTDALRDVNVLATKTARDFQKNKLVPRSSRQHVESIADAAQELIDEIRSFIMAAKTEIETEAKTAA
jgi:hypothetical protein